MIALFYPADRQVLDRQLGDIEKSYDFVCMCVSRVISALRQKRVPESGRSAMRVVKEYCSLCVDCDSDGVEGGLL